MSATACAPEHAQTDIPFRDSNIAEATRLQQAGENCRSGVIKLWHLINGWHLVKML